MSDQQILHPSVRQWFEGLMKGGLSPTQAVNIYEEAVFGGTQAGETELSIQQVLCLFILALYSLYWTYLNAPTVIRTGPYDGQQTYFVSTPTHSGVDSSYF